MKVELSTFLKTKKGPKGPFCIYQRGKEGQISNQFVADLDAITDFLDRHRAEIEALGREVEQEA